MDHLTRLPFLFALTTPLLLLAGLVLHVIVACAVHKDAGGMRQRLGAGPFFFGPAGWFVVSLLAGLVALALYWAMHYSTLRSRE